MLWYKFLCFLPAMRILGVTLMILLPLAVAVQAQDDYSPFTGYAAELPQVSIDTRCSDLQRSVYPDYYASHSARREQRWVELNDSAMVAFWNANGSLILQTLSDLSGLSWQEDEFDIHLIRYYPVAGNSRPTIIPLGGIRRGALTEPMPVGSRAELNLIYQLAGRMLAQSVAPKKGFYHPMADHPLMQPGTYRRDNLAMLLALVTAEQVIGLDSAYSAYQSAFWKQRHRGREIFEQYLLNEWILSPVRPLAQWVVEEPYGSQLVSITRPPRRSRTTDTDRPQQYIEGLPLKGQLGFSITIGSSNRLIVDKIDMERVAYACGLREGDIVREVNGERVRSHKDMIEKILATFDQGGAALRIMRDEDYTTILLQPIDFGFEEDDFFWPGEDTLQYDSTGTPEGDYPY